MPDDPSPPRPPPAQWTSEGDTILNSLESLFDSIIGDVPISRRDVVPPPWQPGHEVFFSSYGGQRSLERRRVTIATGTYTNRVTGNLEINVDGDYTAIIEGGSSNITLTPPPPPPADEEDDEENDEENDDQPGRLLEDAPVSTGTDRLHVKGDAHIFNENRQYIMLNPLAAIGITRIWHGNITKICGMEGVICGGFAQVNHIGASIQGHFLCSGDVYGGSARSSASRIHIGGMTYRSSDYAVWAMVNWSRMFQFIIVPPIGPDGMEESRKRKNWNSFMRVFGTIMPAADILYGLAMGFWGFAKMIFNFLKGLRHPKRLYASMKARAHTESHAVVTVTAGSDMSQ